jgi:hypothetical protein
MTPKLTSVFLLIASTFTEVPLESTPRRLHTSRDHGIGYDPVLRRHVVGLDEDAVLLIRNRGVALSISRGLLDVTVCAGDFQACYDVALAFVVDVVGLDRVPKREAFRVLAEEVRCKIVHRKFEADVSHAVHLDLVVDRVRTLNEHIQAIGPAGVRSGIDQCSFHQVSDSEFFSSICAISWKQVVYEAVQYRERRHRS